jgi:AmiR/NasT family two-component response regulator
VATIGILQQRTIQRSSLLAEQLQSALDSRLVIEQAKGLIAASAGLELDAAFGLLRAFCRDRNLKLGQVAEALACRTLTVADLVTAGRPPGPAR